MTDTPTTRYKVRKQSLGSNVNTWVDPKMNDGFDTFDRGSKGYQALAITGDTTLTWTNYTATNDGQVAILKLTGSLSAVANLVVPSVEWAWDIIWNTTGQTITVKTSAGTGVQIPTGRKARVFCDASDCYFSSANYIGDNITLANARDVVDKNNLETAIANAALPATAGTIRNSAADTTSGYHAAKHTTQVSGATTTQLSGLQSLQFSTVNAGGNEQVALVTSPPYVGGYLPGGTKAAQFTPVVGTDYLANCSSAGITFNLTGMTAPQVDQSISFSTYGTFGAYLLGTVVVNGVAQTNLQLDPGAGGILRLTPIGWN